MRTSRRSAVAASGVAALTLAGCTDQEPGASSSSGLPAPTETETAATGSDPDLEALDRAFALTSGLLADLAASDPRLDAGGVLSRLHTDHLEALRAASADGESIPAPLPRAPRRLSARRLRRQQLAAQRELATLARTARSGALARLLASMSAGIAASVALRDGAAR